MRSLISDFFPPFFFNDINEFRTLGFFYENDKQFQISILMIKYNPLPCQKKLILPKI